MIVTTTATSLRPVRRNANSPSASTETVSRTAENPRATSAWGPVIAKIPASR